MIKCLRILSRLLEIQTKQNVNNSKILNAGYFHKSADPILMIRRPVCIIRITYIYILYVRIYEYIYARRVF